METGDGVKRLAYVKKCPVNVISFYVASTYSFKYAQLSVFMHINPSSLLHFQINLEKKESIKSTEGSSIWHLEVQNGVESSLSLPYLLAQGLRIWKDPLVYLSCGLKILSLGFDIILVSKAQKLQEQ